MTNKRAEALKSTEEDQRQQPLVASAKSEPVMEASDEQKEEVLEKAEQMEQKPKLETLAGLVTIETGLNQQVISTLKLEDDDRQLVTAALDILAEVIDRKITTESTKRYLGLLLMFIRAALAI